MRRVAWGLLQGLDDHSLDVVVADRARGTRTRVVMEPVEAAFDEPSTPLADRRPMHTETRRDLDIAAALRAGQHDAAPQRQRLRRGMPSSPPRQRFRLVVIEDQRCLRTSRRCHDRLPSSLTTEPNAANPPKFLYAKQLTTQVTRPQRPRRAPS